MQRLTATISTCCTTLRRRCNIGPETAQNSPISPGKSPQTASAASAASAASTASTGLDGFSGFNGFPLPALPAAGTATRGRLRHPEQPPHVCRLTQVRNFGRLAEVFGVVLQHADFQIDRHDSILQKKQCDPQDFPCNLNQCGVRLNYEEHSRADHLQRNGKPNART